MAYIGFEEAKPILGKGRRKQMRAAQVAKGMR
jgi:hypothetical protein